jgi:hypothetical protein
VSPMLSKRRDGRGHWPKGKPRNTGQKIAGWHSVDAFLIRLWSFVSERRLKRQLARDLQLEESTVYRWSIGERRPDQEHLDLLVAWYRRMR